MPTLTFRISRQDLMQYNQLMEIMRAQGYEEISVHDTETIDMEFSKPDPIKTPLFRVRVLAGMLNIRSGPASTFVDIGDVLQGQDLSVWEVAPNGWYRIDPTSQRWISGNPAYTVKI